MILYVAVKGDSKEDCIQNLLHADMREELSTGHVSSIGCTKSGIDYDYFFDNDSECAALANLMDLP